MYRLCECYMLSANVSVVLSVSYNANPVAVYTYCTGVNRSDRPNPLCAAGITGQPFYLQ